MRRRPSPKKRQYTRSYWLGDDPTQCLHDTHVQALLELILDYWDGLVGIAALYSLPKQGDRSLEGPQLKAAQVAMRIEALEAGKEEIERFGGRTISLQRDTREESGEVSWAAGTFEDIGIGEEAGIDASLDLRLRLATLHRAFADFVGGILVRDAGAHREALNAYWWIMGLPWLLPPDVSPHAVQTKTCRLSATESPWKVFSLSPEDVMRPRPDYRGRGPLWPGCTREMQAAIEEWSFSRISAEAGLDPDALRRQFIWVSPADI